MEDEIESGETKQGLNKGFIEIRVKVGGIYQRKLFRVSEINHTFGKFKCLIADNNVSPVEMLRISEEYKIPVKNSSATVFPKGKSVKDFII